MPRALSSPAVGRTEIVLGVLAVVSVAAFWSGVPPILVAGAAVLGWAHRDGARGKIALALAALALVADVIVWIGDVTTWF